MNSGSCSQMTTSCKCAIIENLCRKRRRKLLLIELEPREFILSHPSSNIIDFE